MKVNVKKLMALLPTPEGKNPEITKIIVEEAYLHNLRNNMTEQEAFDNTLKTVKKIVSFDLRYTSYPCNDDC